MRLDIVPENPAEQLAGWMSMLPETVVKTVWGFAMARALLTGAELGLFEALRDGPRSAEDLADELGCDAAGLTMLLRSLTGYGTLHRTAHGFGLRREGRRYLTSTGMTDMTAAVRLGGLLDARLRGLSDAVRTGTKTRFHDSLTPEEWEAYLRGLHSLAVVVAREVARKLPLQTPERVLDVGGGHGGFSVALCRRHPALSAEVLDLPGACAVGRALVEEQELSERVRFREGDLREAAWGEGFAAVLLFNVLHNLPETDARRCVGQARAALAPGGLLAVLEAEHSGTSGDLSFQEAFGEMLFYLLSDSQTWPEPMVREWLGEAGLGRIRRRRLFTLPGAYLLTAHAD